MKTRGASQTRATLDGDTVKKPYELPKGLWARIAKKANELWEQCGRREGHDLEDWFDAEAIVMEARREASHMSRIEQTQIDQLDKVSQAGDAIAKAATPRNCSRSSASISSFRFSGRALNLWQSRT